MRNKTECVRKYWKYALFAATAVLIALCVQIGRMDFLLRKYCKYDLYPSRFGQEGLYALFLLTAGFVLYTLWLWISDAKPKKQHFVFVAAVFVVCAVLTIGYCRYHSTVLGSSTNQSKYEQVYDKGLLYDLKKLTK